MATTLARPEACGLASTPSYIVMLSDKLISVVTFLHPYDSHIVLLSNKYFVDNYEKRLI